jgi:hypothetical protein
MGRVSVRWKEDMLVSKDCCFECGSTDKLHFHHVVPEVVGGKKTLPLCEICHGLVHNRDFVKARRLQRIGIDKAMAEGRFVGRRSDTRDTPERLLAKERSQRILAFLKENKYSYSEISKLVPCSRTTIVKVVKALGDKYSVNHTEKLLNKEKSKWIIELLESGAFTHTEISEIVPCGKKLISKIELLLKEKISK